MEVVLLRVGIDSSQNTGGIHGPLLDEDGRFEFIPIAEYEHNVGERTYGNTLGRWGNPFVKYFPQRRRDRMRHVPMHFDPEFESYTYGRTSAKGTLGKLGRGDMLIFYCGLEGCGDFQSEPALYLMGYFEVETAGPAIDFEGHGLCTLFGQNFHVMHQTIYDRERNKLVLVKGYPPDSNGGGSRLLRRAVRISATGSICRGNLSDKMQNIFGNFGGKTCFWRGLHWVDKGHVEQAAEYMRRLE